MSGQFPPCPASLKPIQHYLKTAAEHDQRDPVVSYWCRLYALQCGLKIDKKSEEAKALLYRLMDWLEALKKSLPDNEAITNDVAAQAHIENYALKLFVYADTQDRAGNFGKNVVKAFYTAGMLFDVMQTFGELTDEIIQNRKYAKWKAAYIHNCLKNGETPIPGPIDNDNESGEFDENMGAVGGQGAPGGMGAIGFVPPPTDNTENILDFPQPPPSSQNFPQPPSSHNFPQSPSSGFSFPLPPSQNISVANTSEDISPSAGTYYPTSGFPSTPSEGVPADVTSLNTGFNSPSVGGGSSGLNSVSGAVVLKPEQITKAQKYCKWASSALNYDDVPTAINNLQKAMTLLQTGIDA